MRVWDGEGMKNLVVRSWSRKRIALLIAAVPDSSRPYKRVPSSTSSQSSRWPVAEDPLLPAGKALYSSCDALVGLIGEAGRAVTSVTSAVSTTCAGGTDGPVSKSESQARLSQANAH